MLVSEENLCNLGWKKLLSLRSGKKTKYYAKYVIMSVDCALSLGQKHKAVNSSILFIIFPSGCTRKVHKQCNYQQKKSTILIGTQITMETQLPFARINSHTCLLSGVQFCTKLLSSVFRRRDEQREQMSGSWKVFCDLSECSLVFALRFTAYHQWQAALVKLNTEHLSKSNNRFKRRDVWCGILYLCLSLHILNSA